MKEIRIYFEAYPEVDNDYEEFQQKTSKVFEETGFEYAGYVSFDGERIFGGMEPVYQMICRNVSDGYLDFVQEFLSEQDFGMEYAVHLFQFPETGDKELIEVFL